MGVNLQNALYGKVIKGLFSMIPVEERKVIDLGCGSTRVIVLIGDREYVGADLPRVIDTISKVINPKLKFIRCDVTEEELDFLFEYDIVLMDAFIDVMQYPLKILDKVLQNCSKYILLSRQEIVKGETNVIKNPSYNGFTYHTEIGRRDFNDIVKSHDIVVIKEMDAGIGIWKNTRKHIRYPGKWRSFLLRK